MVMYCFNKGDSELLSMRIFRAFVLPVLVSIALLVLLGGTLPAVVLSSTFWIVVTFHAIQTALCGAILMKSGKLDGTYQDGLTRVSAFALCMAVLVFMGIGVIQGALLHLYSVFGLLAIIDTTFLLFHMIYVYSDDKKSAD